MAASSSATLAVWPVRCQVERTLPADHYTLYHRGPLHEVLRDHLARLPQPSTKSPDTPLARQPAESALDSLLKTLAARGLRAYARELASPEIRACGASVARVSSLSGSP